MEVAESFLCGFAHAVRWVRKIVPHGASNARLRLCYHATWRGVSSHSLDRRYGVAVTPTGTKGPASHPNHTVASKTRQPAYRAHETRACMKGRHILCWLDLPHGLFDTYRQKNTTALRNYPQIRQALDGSLPSGNIVTLEA